MSASVVRAAASSPIVQFFAAGTVIFGLYALGPGDKAQPPSAIVVTASEQQNLTALFEKTWQRPPTQSEMQALIAARIEEEILYREAVKLGLDTDDVVIRRRLVQKIEFVLDDLAARRDPTDEELSAFLAGHADRYAIEASIGFRQIFLSPERRGERLLDDADLVLAALSGGTEPSALGDAAPLPRAMEGAPLSRIARVFGDEFAQAVAAAPVGEWSGPLRSAYGVHVVEITQRAPGRMPSLAEARTSVERDWRDAERQKARATYLQRLRAAYDIRVEMSGATAE